MTLLLRASELVGRPVVTLAGDDVAEVKDVVLGLDSACLLGFTLRGRAFLAGELDQTLPWHNVHAVGRDAVMIASDDRLGQGDRLRRASADGDEIIDIEVMSDAGERLGRVVDVVLSTGAPSEVVGFEIDAAESLGGDEHVLVAVDEMVAVSATTLVVPAEVTSYVRNDLTGFGAGVDSYRNRLKGAGRATS